MEGVFSRIGWFFLSALVFAYTFSLIVGNIVSAQAAGANDTILIRDELQANSHQLSGMVMVTSPCEELSVRTQKISTSNYALILKTWHEPSVTCAQEPTPRAFHTILFAPAAGVYFTATLDGVALPVALVPVVNGTAY